MARIENIQIYQMPEEEHDIPLFEVERDVVGLEAPEVIPVQLMCPAFERFCHVNHPSAELPPSEFVKTAFLVSMRHLPKLSLRMVWYMSEVPPSPVRHARLPWPGRAATSAVAALTGA